MTDPIAESVPASPAPDPYAEVSAELDRWSEVVKSGSRNELVAAFARTRELADRYPQHSELQHWTAEVAFRLSRWDDVVTYFSRGGGLDTNRSDRLFYLAVALYETGDRAAARESLERCLPLVEQTDYVREYVEKIRNGDD